MALSAGADVLWLDGDTLRVDPSHVELQSLPEGAQLEVEVHYRAQDGAGAAVSHSVVIGIEGANDAPVAQGGVSATTWGTGQDVLISTSQAFADVDEGDVLSFSAQGLPSGLSIDMATGVITGSVSSAQASTVTVTATDEAGASAQQVFDLSVLNSPVVNAIGVSDAVGDPAVGRGGDALTVTLTLSEAVNVVGDATGDWVLELVVNGQTTSASYVGGDGSASLSFSAVVPGVGDGADISLVGMSLGGGTVSGVTSGLPLMGGGTGQTTSAYTVDNTPPAAAVIATVNGTSGDLTNDPQAELKISAEPGATLQLYRASDSGPAERVADIAVSEDPSSPGQYTLTPNSALTDGNYGVVVVDAAGNPGPMPDGSGSDVFAVDTSRPTIATVAVTAGTRGVGDSVVFTVTFSEAVTPGVSSALPTLAFDLGDRIVQAHLMAPTAASAANTVQFAYTVQVGDVGTPTTPRIVDQGASWLDAAGNAVNDWSLPAGTDVSGVVFDGTADISGSDASELIQGSAQGEVIAAMSGDDDVQWSPGQDWVDGGDGFDVLSTAWANIDAASVNGNALSHDRSLSLDGGAATLQEQADGSFVLTDTGNTGNATTLSQVEAVGLSSGELLLLNVDVWQPQQGVTRYDGTVWGDDQAMVDLAVPLNGQTTGALSFDDTNDQLRVDDQAAFQLSAATRDGQSVTQMTAIADGQLVAEFAAIESFQFVLGQSVLSIDATSVSPLI